MTDIFVYGTLQFPEIVFALTGKNFKTKEAVLENYAIYKIDSEEGMCPAIIPEKGSSVQGKILFDIDSESMNIIDFFEGDNYEKKKLLVESEKRNFEVLVYVWKENLKHFLKGPWSKEEFEKNYIENCLNYTIPRVLKEYNSGKL